MQEVECAVPVGIDGSIVHENVSKCKGFCEICEKKERRAHSREGAARYHRSTITGAWPMAGSSVSSTSAVFSRRVLVQMQGWQEKQGAS